MAEGEIPVGCVIAGADGKTVFEGKNAVEAARDHTRHAEMMAMCKAGRRALDGATLYVTLEPCPMCAGAIALSGIKRVVFGAYDKKYGSCGSVYRITEDPDVGGYCPAYGGLMRAESEELLSRFFSKLRKGEDKK